MLRSFKIWFLVDLVVLAAAGLQLYVLSTQTERYFAWTIGVPLTAAFLGAMYWGAMPLVYYASRQHLWANARMAVLSVFTFVTISLVVTIAHLDKFHLSESTGAGRFAAWVWMVIYLSVPVLLAVLTVLQLRVPGSDPERQVLLPVWTRTLAGVQAIVLLVSGAVLMVAPTASFWPWQLTPLTGRAIAAWLIGLAVAAGQTVWENDFARVRGGLISVGFAGALQALAVARFSDAVQWAEASAFVYAAFLASMVVLGAYGWLGARAGTRRESRVATSHRVAQGH